MTDLTEYVMDRSEGVCLRPLDFHGHTAANAVRNAKPIEIISTICHY